MQDEDFSQPVFNALPPAVAALAAVIFLVEAIFWLGSKGLIGGEAALGWRIEAIRDYGFFSQLLAWVFETGTWTTPELIRLVSYSFVHLSFTQAIFVIVFLLALGNLVGRVFGNLAVLVLFFSCGIFGAVIYAGLTGEVRPLVGGFPSVYGLIGAYTFFLWVGYGVAGENQYRAFSLIGFLLGIQLVFGVLFGTSPDWVAEVAGFAFGFVLTPALAPGAFRRFLDRMRQR
ncbi:MAG: rhomboid family intramembrane serine protease [Silicimonas sp.]|nr:rhomboid family intramembrane serine protease [Silicimonas sp.]